MISAEIIADSKTEQGHRLTTFILVMPRIILAELNTHRALAKNSASSRAIPFKKMVKMVEENPFIPIAWMQDHKGMQGTEYATERQAEVALSTWLVARNKAVEQAKELNRIGITKQLANRLLEPFLYHTVIISGTEWENFFALRANPDAEIHIQRLAYLMLEAYNSSEPALLKSGEWHIPFGKNIDGSQIDELTRVKIATARCARVSYLNFEGKDDYQADIDLFNRLRESGHFSPMEHCAKAMTKMEYEKHTLTYPEQYLFANGYYTTIHEGWCGNFRGFVQLRKTIENENRRDHRVRK